MQAQLSVQQMEEHEDEETPKVNKHIVFVDDEEELESFSATEYFNTPDELVGRRHNRLTKEQLKEPVIIAGEHLLKLDEDDGTEDTTKAQRKAFRKLQKLQQKKFLELKERKQRVKKIQTLIEEKQLEKNLEVCFL